jgi:hypothetical protein
MDERIAAELEELKRPYKQHKAQARGDAAEPGLGEWDAGEDDEPIPPRGWLLGTAFCRRYLSSLVAGGGTGKTALRIAQALALASDRPLTGEHVFRRSRVLIVSLEDDRDELRRRVGAAMKHHRVAREDVRGWLFLSTPAASGWKLAMIEDGKVMADALGVKLRETIERRKIDIVILDPLVKAHALEENANGHMDFVAGILAQIASEYDCAIDAPHHVAKGAADPGNADRSRGASAFKDACRLVYTLATMTPEEAQAFGIAEAERRLLVRMDSAKVNIAPPAANATWFKLVGVNLGNSSDTYPHGDEAQTVERWNPPNLWQGVSNHIANQILDIIERGLKDGRRYSDHSAAKDTAAWRVVAEYAPGKTESQSREIIRAWVKTGMLAVEEYTDPIRRKATKGLIVLRRPS